MRQNRFAFGLIFTVVLFIGCGPGPHQIDYDLNCAPPYSDCDGVCVDLTTDKQHCGSCYDSVCEEGTGNCADSKCLCRSYDGTTVSLDSCKPPAVCDEGTGLCLTPNGLGQPCNEIENRLCANPDEEVCVSGYCTIPHCDQPEICDNLDNNCDGLVDQTPLGMPVKDDVPCYGGPAGTAGVGICQVGYRFCVAGNWGQCQGEQTPMAETGGANCDGLDNDCNNCIDDRVVDGALVCGVRPVSKKDVTFMIDVSGSMFDKIAATVMAIGNVGSMYSADPSIRWGIERVATFASAALIDVYHVLTAFTPFQTALASLTIANSSGIEPTYDAVWKTANGDFDADLGSDLAARPIYVVFTDEKAQSLLDLTEADVCAAVNSRQAILVVFTLSEYYSYWDECAIIYPLSNNVTMMAANLNNLFDSVCSL